MKNTYIKHLLKSFRTNASLRLITLMILAVFSFTKAKAQVTLFTENWSSSSFATQGWTFTPTQGNWTVDASGSYLPTGGTAPNAYFNWSPSLANYTHSLTSPVINAGAYINITLDYSLQLNNYSTSTLEQFAVDYKTTSSGTWTTLTNYTNSGGSFNVAPVNQALTGMGGNNFQVRFRAYGQNSFNINGWGLDNIVIKGEFIFLNVIII